MDYLSILAGKILNGDAGSEDERSIASDGGDLGPDPEDDAQSVNSDRVGALNLVSKETMRERERGWETATDIRVLVQFKSTKGNKTALKKHFPAPEERDSEKCVIKGWRNFFPSWR